MNHQITILGPQEYLRPGLYCRPLDISQSYDDDYHTMTAYGTVINNFKWILVEEVLGECWLTGFIKIGDYLLQTPGPRMEFIEGQPPATSITTKEEIRKQNGL